MQHKYDVELIRAVVAVVIMVVAGLVARYAIIEAESGKGKWGGTLETWGIVLFGFVVWFFTSTLQPVAVSQYMRSWFNPWQVRLLDQPATPRVDNSKAEYALLHPADPNVGDTWYIWVEHSQANAKDGIPISKTRAANTQFWYSKDGAMSRTQLVP